MKIAGIAGAIILAGLVFFFYKAVQNTKTVPESPEVRIEQRWLPVRETDPFKGRIDAPVTVTMVGSFECPACKDAAVVLDQLVGFYPETVKIVWKDLPESSDESYEEAIAARCAQQQGKFWQYRDLLFARQDETAHNEEFALWGRELGLIREPFEKCLLERPIQFLIDRSINDAVRIGVESVPYFEINNTYRLSGVQTLSRLRTMVDNLLNAR